MPTDSTADTTDSDDRFPTWRDTPETIVLLRTEANDVLMDRAGDVPGVTVVDRSSPTDASFTHMTLHVDFPTLFAAAQDGDDS